MLVEHGAALAPRSQDLSQPLELHPLLCYYLRDHVASEKIEVAGYENLTVYLHNSCLGIIEQPIVSQETLQWLHETWLHENWMSTVVCFGFLLLRSENSELSHCFDIPWLLYGLRALHSDAWQVTDEEELFADITLMALKQILPDYRLSENMAWTSFNATYLKDFALRSTEVVGFKALMLLQWLATYYYDLSRDANRAINEGIILVLKSTELDNVEGAAAELKRFIKCVSLLAATESGALDDTWAPRRYAEVWGALQDPAFNVTPHQKRLLLIWDEDLRCRMSGYEANLRQWMKELCSVSGDSLSVQSLTRL